ncbi:Cheerio / Filamin-A/C -like protein [Dinothrombium tinctorium]|uniref:Cheerio / Filamin-A/C-like protein n=1 Tax=Dinothrombium tinctorium TaxID=1965070 RepID=A0A3S3PWN9_9ACAR|nr:Cheerio / Filamin-A/C -like protein [Dinothrombium tinctorium]
MSEKRKNVNYSIKNISAIGPGLLQGQTAVPCHFTIYTGYFPGSQSSKGVPDPRDALDFEIEGPSEPGPLNCSNNDEDGSVDVDWTPLLPGDYKVYVLFNGMNINGSPFTVHIAGESIRADMMTSKVKVTGDGLKKGVVGRQNRVFIDTGEKAIAGGLAVSIAGPRTAKAKLEMKNNDDGTFDVTYNPDVVGNYLLYVKIADQNIPGSPFTIRVAKV